jgi:hypothetical protein
LVLLLAWLTILPTEGCLPQIEQCLIAINLGTGRLEIRFRRWAGESKLARVAP